MHTRDDKSAYSSQDLRADAKDAFLRAQGYYRELQDIYRYFMPFRQPLQDERMAAADRQQLLHKLVVRLFADGQLAQGAHGLQKQHRFLHGQRPER